MFAKNSRLIASTFFFSVLICFFLTIAIKINFFLNYFINIDSAFYVKWFSDLSLTNQIVPNNENSFYKNLLIDKNSFLHQLLRRYYNNSSEIYTIVPTTINYLLMLSIGPGFKTFNLGSILTNSIIPMICSFYFFKKYKLNNLKIIVSTIFTFLIFLTNFNFFYLSPLGIHNYSLLSLVISFLTIDAHYKKKNFFNYQIIFLAILIPCFTHKFNVPLIFMTLFFVIIYRKSYSNNFKNEFFYLFTLFILIFLPLIIGFYFNPKNLAFLSSFFNDSNPSNLAQKNFFYSLLNYELKIIKYGISKLFSNYYSSLNFIGIILLILSLFKTNNLILKLFLTSNILLFIFLPISYFSSRIFNYQLIIILIIFIEYFVKNISFNNKFLNLIILIIFISFISISSYKTFFKKNLDENANEIIKVYYKGNQELKDFLFSINKTNRINPSNIIFGNYIAKDLFYSYFYEYNKNQKIDAFPSILSLYNNRNNNNYLKSLNIDFKKLYSAYYFNILLKDKNNVVDPTLDKLCEIRTNYYNNCGDIKKVELFINKTPINEVFYNGHVHTLYFYKIEPK